MFVAALLGVLVVVGLALATLGWLVLGLYLALVTVGLAVLVRRARALRVKDTGTTCTCCTSTVYDPIQVR